MLNLRLLKSIRILFNRNLSMAKQVVDDTKFTGTRLPTSVKPVHYDLCLKPNFTDFTFTGQVRIDYQSSATSKHVVLNTVDVEILEGSVESTKSPLTAVFYGKKTETSTLEFQDDIPAQGTICLNFKGTLNDKMHGFYRTAFKVDGETVYAATSQFEATDARRCFPCWDEPAVKATFSVSLIIDKNMTINGKQYERSALSNMPEVSRSGPDSETIVKFDKTPIMSTYLLAFVVGPFEMIEVTNKGRAVRVYTTPGKKELGRFALDAATRSLTFYEEYFKIDYPLPKMDLIAVPDFSNGAMENWGLITYRETCLLVDPANTSTIRRQWIALVVAHEIAHQWFGNLVTMEWWTHLWLNEGFASFMEYICVDKLYPDYEIMSQFITDNHKRAAELDSLHNSHPIEVPVHHPNEIDEIFDSISYSKGATIIRMLYEYIGDECFRKGMHKYLSDFAYKNAVTEDLWDALEAASNKPVRKLMSGWTSRRGYPWLSIQHSQAGDSAKLNVSQSQFTSDGKLSDDEVNAMWMVPMSVITGKNSKVKQELPLLEGKSADIEIEGVGDSWLKLNPGSIGLYRAAYPQALRLKLMPAIKDKTLPAMDRLNLQDDLFALCEAGKASTVDFLNLLQAYKDEDDYCVWVSIDCALARIRTLLRNSDSKSKFFAYCRALYADIYGKLKWDAQPGEQNESMTRSIVINRLISSGDESAIAEAKKRFGQHITGGAALAADLRAAVYKAVATYGDEDSFEQLFKIHRQTDLAEEKNRAASALASTQQADRLERVIKFTMSDEVKLQDKVLVLMPVGANNPAVTFKLLKDNRDFFIEKYGTRNLLTRLVSSSVSSFTSEEDAREVEQYFAANKFPGAERTIQQAIETIRLNANWLARDHEAIKNFLSSF